jgi:diadenylate cyclase
MPSLLQSILEQIDLTAIVDIGITALLIYWLFSLIRGTRAVRLVIGVSVLVVVYGLAVAFDLRLLTQILQAGAVVGLFALVVIFQPELRRALEQIGRVGSVGWLLTPAETRTVTHVSTEVARAAAELSAAGQGALMVLERETGLEEVAETGVMIHGDVSADLLLTIFTPRSPLHDGAVIIREGRIVAAGALLPLAEMSIHTERFGTRHRAALGITEQTDAVVVVVSEENGQISLVERARIVRNLTEAGLGRAVLGLLDPAGGRRGAFGWRSAPQMGNLAVRPPRIREIGRFARHPGTARDGASGPGVSSGATGGTSSGAGTLPPAATADPPAAPAATTAAVATAAASEPEPTPRIPGSNGNRTDGATPRDDATDDGEPVVSGASGAGRAPR